MAESFHPDESRDPGKKQIRWAPFFNGVTTRLKLTLILIVALFLSACPPPAQLNPPAVSTDGANFGIPQFGNSCFFASTMQLLTNDISFNALMSALPVDFLNNNPVFKEYQHFSTVLRTEQNLVEAAAKDFSALLTLQGCGDQQDASEYFNSLINQLSAIRTEIGENFALQSRVQTSWQENGGGANLGPLDPANFFITIDLPDYANHGPAYSLGELLQNVKGPRQLNDYVLADGSRVNAEQITLYSKLSKSLVFYELGLIIDPRDFSVQKVPYSVSLPKKLDMRPFVGPDFNGSAAYELLGAAFHGGTSTGGHYIAIVKDKITKKWYIYNDQNKSELSDTDAEKIFLTDGKYEDFTPVLIFYEREG